MGGQKFFQNAFHIMNRRGTDHARSKRRGVRKAFTVPAEMLAHPWKVRDAEDRLKLSGMFDHDSESLRKVHLNRSRRALLPFSIVLTSHECTGRVVGLKKPRASQGPTAYQNTMHARVTNTADDVLHGVHIAIAQQPGLRSFG